MELRRWSALQPGLDVSPLVGLAGSWMSQDGYSETGGGVENFDADDQSRESFQSLLGLEVRWQTSARREMELTAAMGWQYELGDTSSSLSGTYAGDATGTVLSSESPSDGRNALALGLGATFAVDTRNTIHLEYGASYNAERTDQAVALRWSMEF